MQGSTWFSVNGRSYAQTRFPAVVVCLDGCEPAYLESAIASGAMPTLEAILKKGSFGTARSAMPSFTNPNNLSIATGQPPSVHGICGNYFYDAVSGEEVMMNEARFLRAPTIFEAASTAGAKVAVVTAKDKLKTLLGAGLRFQEGAAVCISSERSASSTEAGNGIRNAAEWLGVPQPEVYSSELSEFVLAAGVKLLRDFAPDLMYLTTTDYIQHKFAPEDLEAVAFYAMVDRHLADLDSQDAAIVITADHGMKSKHGPDGSPFVLYVQDLLDEWLGRKSARVVLPITDPYVVHHGALGSFATVYLPQCGDVSLAVERLGSVEGIDLAISREEASVRFELPPDRIGDIVLVSEANMTLGTTRERHDLSVLDAPLRSHGGLSEQDVPFIVNRRVDLPDAPSLRNFDAFHYAAEAAAIEVQHG